MDTLILLSTGGKRPPQLHPYESGDVKGPHPSAGARRRVAIGHPDLHIANIAKIAATPSIVVKSRRRGFLGSLWAFIENSEVIV